MRSVNSVINDFESKEHDLVITKSKPIVRKTKKVKQLFPLKEKNPYHSCKIYEGVCSCKENYIGETKRNVITCWNEHENANKD